MVALALIDALPDFAARPLLRPPPPPPPPPIDVDAIVARKVAEAEAALAEQFQQVMEVERTETQRRHLADLTAERARLGEEAAALLRQRLEEMELRLAALGGDALSRILGALMSEELSSRAIANLAQTVRAALADREAVRVEICGPASLIESLRGALGDAPATIEWREAAGLDVLVAIDGDLFETRLGEWSAALSDILA